MPRYFCDFNSTAMFRWTLLLGAVLAVIGGTAFAQETTPPVVPDPLETSAQANKRALQSLQLGLSVQGGQVVSVGAGGAVLTSTDGGETWRQTAGVPVSVTLTSVSFASQEIGVAVGHSGAILRTEDGGQTWKKQLDGVQAADLALQEAKELEAAGAEGAERALRNAEYLIADGPDKPFLNVHFKDSQTGWAVGAYGLAMMTQDGGATWTSVTAQIPNSRGMHLYQVRSRDNLVLIVGEQGTVIVSTDGGETFQEIETPYGGSFFGAVITREGRALVYGLKGNAWLSNEDFSTWKKTDLDQPITVVTGAQTQNGRIFLADEAGHLLQSDDGGRSFSGFGEPVSAGATDIALVSGQVLIIAGPRGNSRLDLSTLPKRAH
ncbi:MAG: WD40/YVTN/BNR-like repeat-containing protein [Magnetospiraceae bacterium]